MLRRIDGAVLAACAAEANHEVGESPIHIPLDGGIHDLIDMLQEVGDLAVLLQEADDGFVESRKLLVGFVATGASNPVKWL